MLARPSILSWLSSIKRIPDCRSAQTNGAGVVVAETITRLVFLECATDVVFAVDDDPAVTDTNAFQGRRHFGIACTRIARGGRFSPAAHARDGAAVELRRVQFI